MSAPLRVKSHPSAAGFAADAGDTYKDYLNRLVKLVPAEVVGLYLVGKSAILAHYPAGGPPVSGFMSAQAAWIIWSAFCLVALFIVRGWATSDPKRKVPPEYAAIAISAVSYLIWVYSFGDVFTIFNLWDPLIATFLVLAWTFIVPIFYRES